MIEGGVSTLDQMVTNESVTRFVSFDDMGITFRHIGHQGPEPTWTLPTDGPRAVAGSLSGDRVVTATTESMRMWHLDSKTWQNTLCRITGGGLSDGEWRQYTPRSGNHPRPCAQSR